MNIFILGFNTVYNLYCTFLTNWSFYPNVNKLMQLIKFGFRLKSSFKKLAASVAHSNVYVQSERLFKIQFKLICSQWHSHSLQVYS